MTSSLERFAVDIDELEIEPPPDDDVMEQVKALLRGEKFNPNHEPAGSPTGGQFASDGGGGGDRAETVTPQQWADDWRSEFLGMMKSMGVPDEFAEKMASDTVHLPKAAVRVRSGNDQVYVIDRTGKAADADMKRIGRYAMEAVQRDPQEHLSRHRTGNHLQISIVDQMSVNDAPGILGSSSYHGQDIEFKPRVLTLERGNRGEWMPAANRGDILRYLIAHEYGHVRASEEYGKPDSPSRLPQFKAASTYARTSPHEAYAEGYAQWVTDKSVVPELAEVAKAEGWPGAN